MSFTEFVDTNELSFVISNVRTVITAGSKENSCFLGPLKRTPNRGLTVIEVNKDVLFSFIFHTISMVTFMLNGKTIMHYRFEDLP